MLFQNHIEVIYRIILIALNLQLSRMKVSVSHFECQDWKGLLCTWLCELFTSIITTSYLLSTLSKVISLNVQEKAHSSIRSCHGHEKYLIVGLSHSYMLKTLIIREHYRIKSLDRLVL